MKRANSLHIVLFITCVAILVRVLFVSSFRVTTDAMSPSIFPGDFIVGLSSRVLPISYERNDIVGFTRPDATVKIRRILGVPGDKVEMKNQQIFINDKAIEDTGNLADLAADFPAAILLGRRQLFVVSENPAHQPFYEVIDRSQISGKLNLIWLSYESDPSGFRWSRLMQWVR